VTQIVSGIGRGHFNPVGFFADFRNYNSKTNPPGKKKESIRVRVRARARERETATLGDSGLW
jgi:hypothetical protein